jgi:hypothetical protein
MVGLRIERFDPLIAGPRVLPHRVGLLVKEEGAVAGILGIEIDLALEQRVADDLGRPQLQFFRDL